jgi:hypothetical protein
LLAKQHAPKARPTTQAVPVSPIAAQEWVEVELVDNVEDEPGKVASDSQSRRAGGSGGLVAVAAKEVVGGHA